MRVPKECLQLRIYMGEEDRHDNESMYEWIVARAREMGLAGMTVWRGMEGYGSDKELHTSHVLRLSSDLPVILEAVDAPEKIRGFIKDIESVIQEKLVTIQEVTAPFGE